MFKINNKNGLVKSIILFTVIMFSVLFLFACGQDDSKKVNKIMINQRQIQLVVGESEKLSITILPSTASDAELIFTTGNSNVAVVDNQGNVKGVGSGETNVTVTAQNGGATTHIPVSVINQPKQLEKVTGLAFDTDRIVWNRVENNSGYEILLNGEVYEKIITTQYFKDFEIGVENTISVRAIGNKKAYLDSEYSDEFIFKQLPTPEISISGGVININPNFEETSNSAFRILLNGETFIQRHTSLRYIISNELPSGFCAFRVCTLGDASQNTYSSVYSNTITVNKLLPPTDAQIEDKILTFSNIGCAESYDVKIIKDGKIYKTLNSIPATSTFVRCDLSDEGYVAGEYEVYVKSNGDKITTLDSNYSPNYAFDKLSTPANVKIENGVITWDEVENASGYKLNIELNDKITYEENIIEHQCNFALKYTKAGVYKVKVTATSGSVGEVNRFLNSNYSNELTITKLAIPSQISVKNDNFVWSEVSQSNGYIVLIDESDRIEIEGQSYLNAINQELEARVHMLRVQALGNGKEIIDSEFSETFEFVKKAKVSGLYLDGATVCWSAVKDTVVYNVFINDDETPVRSTTTSIDLSDQQYESGVYSVKVQAMSSNNKHVSGDKSEAKTFSKLPTPTNLNIKDGILHYSMPSGTSFGGYIIRINGSVYTTSDDWLDFDTYISNDEVRSVTLQAEGDNNTTISSSLSEVIKIKKMSNDVRIRIENDSLIWESQERAKKYIVSIDYIGETASLKKTIEVTASEPTSINLATNSNFLDAGDYSISLKVISKDCQIEDYEQVYDVISRSTEIVVARKIKEVGDLRVKNGVVVWDVVKNVVFYEVFFDGVSQGDTCGTKNEFAVPGNSGSHTVKVVSRGNSTGIINSTVTKDNTITVTKLPSIFNIKISGTKITWDAIPNAISYDIDVVDIYSEPFGQNNLLQTQYDMSNFGEGGKFYVRLKANGDNTKYVSGNFGTTNSDLQYYEVKTLAPPKNLRIENEVLYFSYSQNADKYEIEFVNGEFTDKQHLTKVGESDEGTLNLSEYLKGKKDGNYRITMRAIDDSVNQTYINSRLSNSVYINKLSTPVLSVINGELNYTSVYSTSEYELTIKSVGETEPMIFTIQDLSLSVFELGKTFIAGQYTVSMIAKGNGRTTATSETSEEITIEKLGTPTASPTDLRVERGQIIFNDVPNATLYKIITYDNMDNSVALKTFLIPNGKNEYLPNVKAGNYYVGIVAIGDDSRYITSDEYIYNKTLKKLNVPDGLTIKNGIINWKTYIDFTNVYELVINNEYVDVGFRDSYELTEEKGYNSTNYSIMIRAIGNDVSELTSNLSDPLYAEKLVKMQLRVVNGVIQWENSGAYKYNVEITDSEGVQTNKEFERIAEYSLTTFESGFYNIRIKQFGSESIQGNNGYLNSDFSDVFLVYKMGSPMRPHINTEFLNDPSPENLAKSGNLEWDAVENATKYVINYKHDTYVFAPITVENTYYKFADETLEIGEYEFNIYSRGTTIAKDGKEYACVNSDTSYMVATKLANPVSLYASNGVFHWDKNEFESAVDVRYIVRYYYAEIDKEFDMNNLKTEFADNINFKTLNALGRYRLSVYSVGSNCIQSDIANLKDDYTFDLFSAGKGTSDDPYLIKEYTVDEGTVSARTYTALEQLIYINYMYDKHFKIMEDITIDATFSPLGTLDELSFARINDGYSFIGEIDGDNHSITFAGTNGNAFGNVGNFGFVSSIGKTGAVKNLNFYGFLIAGSYNKIGVVTASNDGLISQVKVINISGGISSSFDGDNKVSYVGGIAGENTENGRIEKCFTKILIRATNAKTYVNAGGIVGQNYGAVIDCETTAMLDGITAVNEQIIGAFAGGITGYCSGNKAIIDGCKNSASITAKSQTGAYASASARSGGIVGKIEYKQSESGSIMPLIRSCYNIGVVNAQGDINSTDENNAKVGGIAGFISGGTIDSCYNVGTVYVFDAQNQSSSLNIGAIVGWNDNIEKSVIRNCYYIDYNGIPNSCTTPLQEGDMTQVTADDLKSDASQENAVINKLNKNYNKFIYYPDNYPALNWENIA